MIYPLNWEDSLDLDGQLTDEERAVRGFSLLP